ncbi:hypothetical protein AAFF_G00033950 [Aldrovandia affinis]|uniref:Uncharacterized protein n=1 Tax=Aldrovandia affinis TaxID=143900 RepID=A0AAD7S3Q7_9TELE|nr:hypothetical protein AAFF_G00033950 [Aldrovandia affinis]
MRDQMLLSRTDGTKWSGGRWPPEGQHAPLTPTPMARQAVLIHRSLASLLPAKTTVQIYKEERGSTQERQLCLLAVWPLLCLDPSVVE